MSKTHLHILPIFILCSQVAVAAPKPVCDSKAVTRNCAFFEERRNQKIITLPDGSTMTNPRYVEPKRKSKSGSFPENLVLEPKMVSPQQSDEYLTNQARVMDSLGNTNLTTRFKLGYLREQMNSHLKVRDTFSVPWPPDDPNAKKQPVKTTEIEAYLKKKLSSKQYAELDAGLKALNKPALLIVEKMKQEQIKELAQAKAEAERLKLAIAQREKKKARIAELFKYAQEQVIQVITRGKKETDLTPAEKSMILKVSTVRLDKMETTETAESSHCADGFANAFYGHYSHSVTVCDGKITKSDPDLIFTFGHELAHAVDPCSASMPFWKVDPDKFRALKASKLLTPAQKSRLELLKLEKFNLINYDLAIFENDTAMVEKLISSGALSKLTDGTNDATFPFKTERECLVKRATIKETTPKEIQESETILLAQAQEKSGQALNKNTIKRYSDALKKYPQCLATAGQRTKINESISDMFGAIVAEKYILENPFKSELEKVAAIPFAHGTCATDAQDLEQYHVSPYRVQEVFTSPSFTDEHLQNTERVELLRLNLPGMAKIYNCERKAPACFDHLSFSTRLSSKLPSNRKEGRR